MRLELDKDTVEALRQYLHDRADVDYEGTGPGVAMSLLMELDRAIEESKR